jgi:2-iminobutanoate/2-iminopropanoate deaminase
MNLRPLIGICCALAAAVIGYLVLAERREGPDDQATIAADTVIYHTPFGAPTRPFSPAVQVGNVIFLSGQIGTDASASGGVVPGGIEAETRQTMENIKQVLTAIGRTMDDVVKCTVMMQDMREWDRMNTVYRTYFREGRLPARSALGANGLALGARVEIECIAAA